MKIGIRTKFSLLGTFLLFIPWLGYQYIWQMEGYLRQGQEQTLLGTAQALATALHERPKLFNNQASFLPNVEQGKDLYGYKLTHPIQLDGLLNDWPQIEERSHYYDETKKLSLTKQTPSANQAATSLRFNMQLGKYDKYLYLYFDVIDDKVIFRDHNSLKITKNDHLEIGLVTPQQQYHYIIVSNKQAGWLDAFETQPNNITLTNIHPTNMVQGTWLNTNQGYRIELRIPLSLIGGKIAFALNDVDQVKGDVISRIGSAEPRELSQLGTILVPSPEIERIVKGMSYSHSRLWVVDQHHRVLAKSGDIQSASGVWQQKAVTSQSNSWWQQWFNRYLHPLYYQILTKPSNNFIDQAVDASNLTGDHIARALQGTASSNWRVTDDKKAVILSAAYPIYINHQVHGAVVVEQNTNGIRLIRNQALEKLFTAMLAIFAIGALVFFIFASRIAGRIRKLRDQTEQAIDQHGKIVHLVEPTNASDEIGDLTRSFAQVIERLKQYHNYLEQMASRLSHELRTPIAMVKTSLENLTLQQLPEQSRAYVQRAEQGVTRLNQIITDMSEATRLEHMLQHTEKQVFDLANMLELTLPSYQAIYPDVKFHYQTNSQQVMINGSPEHLAQCLDKLLANAGEFANDQQVMVQLTETKQKVELYISNNGPLLTPELINTMFDSMVSIRENSQNHPHLGLGLYIARMICEFHQAKISAQNHYAPDGVTICIQLPKAQ